MNIYLISDTHLNYAKIATYCDRPADFTDLLVRNWCNTVKADDLVIHVGDVFIGPVEGWRKIHPHLPGRKLLIRGNHDRQRSVTWWMNNGFDIAVDECVFRNCLITHEPRLDGPSAMLNIHGHWHNAWHGFTPDAEIAKHPAHCRLFAVEYTKYMPIEFNKFLAHPEKYQAVKPK